jgi:hypothetical protein
MVAFSRLLQFLDQVAASGGRNKCQASRFWFGNGMAANVSSASPPPLAAAAAVVVPFVILSTPRSVAGRSTSRGASSSALCIASGLDLDLDVPSKLDETASSDPEQVASRCGASATRSGHST